MDWTKQPREESRPHPPTNNYGLVPHTPNLLSRCVKDLTSFRLLEHRTISRDYAANEHLQIGT